MNKTILSIAVGVVFFLAFSHSDANVCTAISAADNLNCYRKTSQGLVTISNDTDQCKFRSTNNNNLYTRHTYRTNNLNTRSESRWVIRLDGKEEVRRSESRTAIRVDGEKAERRSDNRRVIRVDGKEEERRSDNRRVIRVDGKGRERSSENRRVIRVEGKEGEGRVQFRADDARRVRLTRSRSLPDIRRERVRGARERDVTDVKDADRRVLERSDRRFLENRSYQRTFRREVRDGRLERQTIRDDRLERQTSRDDRLERQTSRDDRLERQTSRDDRLERQTSRDDTETRRSRASGIRQSNMIAVKDNDTSTSWPFSSFVQSTIGVLGLYYFGMHNKSTK